MANKYFNKQVAESRKPLNIGGPIPRGGLKFQEEQLEKAKNKQDKKFTPRKKQKPTNPLEPTSKDIEKYKSKTKSESPERIKRQADYMKKHGENPPRRKTLSVTNSYKKEVEGLK